jgi:Ca-activated chloride channel family protein
MHLNATLDLDVVAIEAQDQIAVLLELAAPAADSSRTRPPSTLQVVLDRSGSMAGGALESAKAALIDLVGRLEPTDHFGLVAFDDEVQIAVPAAPLADKDVVRSLIGTIQPGGTTNLSGGYLRGLQEARRVAGAGGATLVLLSDGHANVGLTDADKLGAVAADARGHRVTTSTVGLGLGYDETLLAALARGGAGDTHFAEEGDTAAAALASEVHGLLEQVVQAASLTVRPTGAVESIALFNDLATVGVEDGFMVELGDFLSGEQRKLLLEIDVPAMAATMSTKKVTIPVSVNVVPGDQAAGRTANPVVVTERVFQQAQRDKQAATDKLRAGDAPAAAQMYASAAQALAGFTDADVQEEFDVLHDLARRAEYDAVRAAKQAVADRHRKSRRRG